MVQRVPVNSLRRVFSYPLFIALYLLKAVEKPVYTARQLLRSSDPPKTYKPH